MDQRYGHMLHEYYVTRLREIMTQRRERLRKISTRAEADMYAASVRRAAGLCLGPFPMRTPLNMRITGTLVSDGYTIEGVLFESRPGVLVTGNLYRPDPARFPEQKKPGVLGLCGHSALGKAEPAYQAFCQALAENGFVVLIIDPIQQGERWHCHHDDGTPDTALCKVHNAIGNRLRLMGDSLSAWRVWDAIRGLDCLASLPDVDTECLGVTGNSGGGTLTTFLSALDPRLAWAAPSCHVSGYLADLENELPRDAEQNPPGLLEQGLDTADLLMAFAPRPTLVLAQYDDFFDARASETATDEMARVHLLLGRAKTARFFRGPGGHGYCPACRNAMVAFAVEQARPGASVRLLPPLPRSAEELRATPEGTVRGLDGSRMIPDLLTEALAALPVRHHTNLSLTRAVRKTLAIPGRVKLKGKAAPHGRFLWNAAAFHGMRCSQFAVETDPGIVSIVTFPDPEWAHRMPKNPVTLFIGDSDALRDFRTVPWVGALAESVRGAGGIIGLLDPRGFGVTMAATCGSLDFFDCYGSDFLYAATSDMLGEPLLGKRVWDVMRTIDCLVANGCAGVSLAGRGVGGTVALCAAFLHPSQPMLRLEDAPLSWKETVADIRREVPFSSMAGDALKAFDLPDLAAALGKRLSIG